MMEATFVDASRTLAPFRSQTSVSNCVELTNSVARRTQENWRYWRILDREILDRPSLHFSVFVLSDFHEFDFWIFLSIRKGTIQFWEPFYTVWILWKKDKVLRIESVEIEIKYNFFKAKRGNNYCKTIRTSWFIPYPTDLQRSNIFMYESGCDQGEKPGRHPLNAGSRVSLKRRLPIFVFHRFVFL